MSLHAVANNNAALHIGNKHADLCCCAGCSAQYRDADGSWAPVAVKVLPYATAQEVYLVDREVAAMAAVQSKPSLDTLLSEHCYADDGLRQKYVVMR